MRTEGRAGTAHADGLEIRYREYGDGAPVVLVHGWGSDAYGNWVRTGWVEALARERRVVTLDVRGHGASDKPLEAERYRYAALASDVLAVLDAASIERADLVGYSMGAFMGAALLGRAPERFAALVLGGVGIETPESIAVADRIAAALRAPGIEALSDPLGIAYRRFVDADATIDARGREALAVSALAMWPDGDAIGLAGARGAAAENPVQVVVGGEDPPYTASAPRLVAALANADLRVLPGEDHLGAMRAPAFLETARGFLREAGLGA